MKCLIYPPLAYLIVQDAILEQMSAQDFNDTVRCKTLGTKNLDDAFATPTLDFFIMLSSIASTIGNRAQANYAAGNTYLDSFAHFEPPRKASYVSINLGFIADSETISNHPERAENLSKVGCIPITLEQVFKVLARAMSLDDAASDQAKQLVVGLNGHSLAHGTTNTVQKAMFKHLQFAQERVEGKMSATKPGSITDVLKLCKDQAQLEKITTDAISQQVSSIMALKSSDIPLRTSLIELGLDSLAAVELKNWISRALHAALQISEILDASGIQRLAEIVVQRSKLVRLDVDSHAVQPGPLVNGVKDTTYAEPEFSKLPDPPLPDLEQTLKLYRNAVVAFCSDVELLQLDQSISELTKPNSFGQQLQERLRKRITNPNADGWLWDLYNAHAHLRSRIPINPFQHFYGSHFEGPTNHSQAERAAIITKAVVAFKSELRNGLIKPDLLHGKPLCMKTLDFLFNAVRQPHKEVDKLQRFPGNDYIVVMKCSQFFEVPLEDENGELSLETFMTVFQSICNRTVLPSSAVAALTAANRDDWAEVCGCGALEIRILMNTGRFETRSGHVIRKTKSFCRASKKQLSSYVWTRALLQTHLSDITDTSTATPRPDGVIRVFSL